jgi:HK97 family phage prohead protease
MATKTAIYDVASFKALDDGERGEFEALVSVFHNVDLQGDRVMPGAFKSSILEWRGKGDPVPIVWAHDWANPHAHIGSADANDVEETEAGLKVKGRIDLDNPFAAQVFRLLKERRVREFSFAYDIRKEKRGKDGANELHDLGIIEAGPTLKGANPNTELLSVKSDLEAAAALETVPTVVVAPSGDDDTKAIQAAIEVAGLSGIRWEPGDYHISDNIVVPAKAGRRISRATQSELSAAIDGVEKELTRLRGLLSSDSDDEKDEDEADAVGKAIDDDLIRYEAAIAAAM